MRVVGTNLQVKRAERGGGGKEDGWIKVMSGMMDGERKRPDGERERGGMSGGEQSGRVIVKAA